MDSTHRWLSHDYFKKDKISYLFTHQDLRQRIGYGRLPRISNAVIHERRHFQRCITTKTLISMSYFWENAWRMHSTTLRSKLRMRRHGIKEMGKKGNCHFFKLGVVFWNECNIPWYTFFLPTLTIFYSIPYAKRFFAFIFTTETRLELPFWWRLWNILLIRLWLTHNTSTSYIKISEFE